MIAARTIKKFLTAVFVLTFAALFISLGFWQLGRAQEMKRAVSHPAKVDSRIYPVAQLITPTASLDGNSIGKMVVARGHYIANFKAPNQIDATGKRSDWEVALLQTDTDSAILVVRGYWKDRFASPEIVMATNVTVTGALRPHQSEDVAVNTPQQLSRLDSSLLTSFTNLQLYDGFITAMDEETRSGLVDRTRVEVAPSDYSAKVPGYYWQHISYVGIWWLMALLVLWMPFYKREDKMAS